MAGTRRRRDFVRGWSALVAETPANALAHFMADAHARLQRVDLVKDNAFACPLTQEHLADLLGLTSVHVNRVLGRLRAEGVLVMSGKRVVIVDLPALHQICGFDWAAQD